MIIIGLTGSIGMGKSATAELLRAEGLPVFDSDACVHALYAPGGAAVEPVGAAFPGCIVDGAVDRASLSSLLARDPEGFQTLEAIVHPLVSAARDQFLADAAAQDAWAVVFDIPLLFETGAHALVDVILVVHAPDDIRRARVLDRPGMTADKLDQIIARQMPDAQKLEQADYAIETSGGLADAREQVRTMLHTLRKTFDKTPD